MHFVGVYFIKGTFFLLAPPKQVPFLISSNENNFIKTQGSRLGMIIATKKGLA